VINLLWHIYIFTEYCIIHTSMLALPTENELFEILNYKINCLILIIRILFQRSTVYRIIHKNTNEGHVNQILVDLYA